MSAQGDDCEGYPLKFCGLASRGRLSGKSYPVPATRRPSKKRRLRASREIGDNDGDANRDTDRDASRETDREVDGDDTFSRSERGSLQEASPLEPHNILMSLHSHHSDKDFFYHGTPLGRIESGGFGPDSGDTLVIVPSLHGGDSNSHLSPATVMSRDHELLQPLDAVSGIPISHGQRILLGLNAYNASKLAEDSVQPPNKQPVARRISWASRLAAVRLDALPSLSSRDDESSLTPVLDPERVRFLLEYCKSPLLAWFRVFSLAARNSRRRHG